MATEDDLPQVVGLWSKLTSDEQALGIPIVATPRAHESWVASFRRHLGKLAFLWVVEDERGRIGAFVLTRLKIRPPYLGAELVGEIASIYVDPDQRGRGVGEALLRTAIEGLRTAGAQAIETTAHVSNPDACAFWEACGFAPGFRTYRMPLT